MAPIATFAAEDSVSNQTKVKINSDGIVTIVNAEVTSISGNIIGAVSRFKNTVMNWSFLTSATTTFTGTHGAATTSGNVALGDRINVTGALSSIGSTLGLTVFKIHDVTAQSEWKVKNGRVQSINTTNGTFVLKSDEKLITVKTNASTSFLLGNVASTTLSSMMLNSKVKVYGSFSADGSTFTATKIVVHMGELKRNWKNNDREKDGEDHNNR